MNNSEYKLGIIELFFPNRHLDSFNVFEHQLNGFYICTLYIGLNNFYNKKLIGLIQESYKMFYDNKFIDFELDNHYYHPNFKHIVKNDNYFNIKLLKVININNNEIIIDITYFLRIIQRKWKKYYYKNYHLYNNFIGSFLERSFYDDAGSDVTSEVSSVDTFSELT